MTDVTPQDQAGSTPPPTKKWAGKFDTPEQLEEAYNGTAKVYQENQELKAKHEEAAKKLQSIEEKKLKDQQEFENRKTSIGQEKINVLQDYVKKNYPEKLHTTVFNEIIKDDEAMTQAMKDRDARLNSRVPGVDIGSTAAHQERYDGQAEVIKARENLRKNPSEANKKKYIDVCRQVGEARFKK